MSTTAVCGDLRRGPDPSAVFNLRHLETLRLVLELGSFSAAARSLGYSTSAVSQQVAATERALGITLFERSPQRIVPTEAALLMGRHATALLQRADRAMVEMQDYVSGTRGRVRVAAFGSAAARLLPLVLARFATDLPDADIDLRVTQDATDDLPSMVESGACDIALDRSYRSTPRSWPSSLCATRLLTEEMVVLTAVDHPARTAVEPDLRHFADDSWVTNFAGSYDERNLLEACAQAGFAPDIRYRTDEHDLLRGIVRTGSAVALVPPLALGTDRSIPFTRLRDDAPTRDVVALWRAEDQDQPLSCAVRTGLADAARQFVGWSDDAFQHSLSAPLVYAR